MAFYSVISGAAAVLLLLLAVKSLGSVGMVLFQLLMAGGITATIMAPAAGEGVVPGNINKNVFIWLGVASSVAQMVLTALMPDIFWLNTAAYLMIAAHYRDVKRQADKQPEAAKQPKPKPAFNLPNKLYFLPFCVALPLGALDYRFFLPVCAVWTFALWCFKHI